jgi:hypothetical protein
MYPVIENKVLLKTRYTYINRKYFLKKVKNKFFLQELYLIVENIKINEY